MAKVVLITGTSTGIGKATALHFARAGYNVFASMRNPDNGAALLALAATENLNLAVVRHDVCDPDSNQSAVDEVTSAAGQIDVLINNAGISGGGAFEETATDDLRSVMETNFFGVVDLTQRVLPQMRQRRSGCILNVSSVSGVMAFAPQMSYAASKWALEAASEILATEMAAFDVRVAMIEPGIILTPIFEKNMEQPDSESPYLMFYERMARIFEAGLQHPTMPEAVAEVMQQAVETTSPRFRYLVGDDALSLVKGRNALSDEEWIAIGRMSPDEFAQFAGDRLGLVI